jgi:hypothetical protein
MKGGGIKMGHLKEKTVKKCVSLLREYIDATALNHQKESAILALNQLQKITAGKDSTGSSDADGSNPTVGPRSICWTKPRSDG